MANQEMVSLYNLAEAFKKLTDLERVGEMGQEEYNDYVDMLQIDLANKGESCVAFLRNSELGVDAIDTEIERLQKLKKSNVNAINKFKNYMLYAMEAGNLTKIDTPLGIIGTRKSESIQVTDETLLPQELMREKVTRAPDKKAIKEAIKKGEQVSGAVIKYNKTLTIK